MARGGSQLAGQADLMINPLNKYLTNYRKRLPKQGWIFFFTFQDGVQENPGSLQRLCLVSLECPKYLHL